MRIKSENKKSLEHLKERIDTLRNDPEGTIEKICSPEIEDYFEYFVDIDEHEGEKDYFGVVKGYQNPEPGYWAHPNKQILFAIINVNARKWDKLLELRLLYTELKPVSPTKYDAETKYELKVRNRNNDICVPLAYQKEHIKTSEKEISEWISDRLGEAQTSAIEIRRIKAIKYLKKCLSKEIQRDTKTKSRKQQWIHLSKAHDIEQLIAMFEGNRKIKKESKKGKQRKQTSYILPQNEKKARKIAFASVRATQEKGLDATAVDVTKIYLGIPLDQQILGDDKKEFDKRVDMVRDFMVRMMMSGFMIRYIYNPDPKLHVPKDMPFFWPLPQSPVRKYKKRDKAPLFTDQEIREFKKKGEKLD